MNAELQTGIWNGALNKISTFFNGAKKATSNAGAASINAVGNTAKNRLNSGNNLIERTKNFYKNEKAAFNSLREDNTRLSRAENIKTINEKLQTEGLSNSTRQELISNNPTIGNGFVNSLLSRGAFTASGVGAGIGATYGLMSDNTSIIGGASLGAGIGMLGRGIAGTSGETLGLLQKSSEVIKKY